MLVHPDEKVPIARLLTFLEHGERMHGSFREPLCGCRQNTSVILHFFPR
jgi:hypothetical protein